MHQSPQSHLLNSLRRKPLQSTAHTRRPPPHVISLGLLSMILFLKLSRKKRVKCINVSHLDLAKVLFGPNADVSRPTKRSRMKMLLTFLPKKSQKRKWRSQNQFFSVLVCGRAHFSFLSVTGRGRNLFHFHPEESVEEEEWLSEIDTESLEHYDEEDDEEDMIWKAMEPEINEVYPPQIDIDDEGLQEFVKVLE